MFFVNTGIEKMKVTNEIYQVGGAGLTSHEDAAVYLINFGGSGALVDAGCGRSEAKLLDNIRSCGIEPEKIEYLLITHCHFDHSGGAKTLRERLQCQLIAHALDAQFLEQADDTVTAASWYGSSIQPLVVDRKLSGAEEDIQLGGRLIKALHTPGHSPGSVVYLTASEGFKVLFAQDVHGPLDPRLLSNKKDYFTSLELLLSLEADILCEGHFGVYKGRRAVERFIRSFCSE
jgi:glyoxylase-like metal-dependent hydrolase (beta-lactamase superfamily II)